MTASTLDLDSIPYGASTIAIAAHRLSQLLRSEFERTLSDHGELSLIEWRICVGLSRSTPITQKELVGFTRMQQAQVSRALLQLEERGLIESRPCNQDRRARRYSLTDNGRAHFDHNWPVAEAHRQAVDGALDPAEVAQYLEMSERIALAAQQEVQAVS